MINFFKKLFNKKPLDKDVLLKFKLDDGKMYEEKIKLNDFEERVSELQKHGGGITIDNYHSRSQEDFENAELFKEYSFITNYVIEPTKSNNTYKAGKFNHQIQPDNYIDVQTNLSLQQLCSYF